MRMKQNVLSVGARWKRFARKQRPATEQRGQRRRPFTYDEPDQLIRRREAAPGDAAPGPAPGTTFTYDYDERDQLIRGARDAAPPVTTFTYDYDERDQLIRRREMPAGDAAPE